MHIKCTFDLIHPLRDCEILLTEEWV